MKAKFILETSWSFPMKKGFLSPPVNVTLDLVFQNYAFGRT